MLLEELIGKKVTNIFQVLYYEEYGLDKGESFIELDNEIVIEIPYGFDDEVTTKELDDKATSIFDDLSDSQIYHVNKEGKSIKEIADEVSITKPTFWEKMKHFIRFGKILTVQQNEIVEYEPYKIEYVENKLKYIKNRIIVDIINFDEDDERVFLELDNGYLISERNFSMNGTGRVGINVYYNINDITDWKGNEFKRISAQKK